MSFSQTKVYFRGSLMSLKMRLIWTIVFIVVLTIGLLSFISVNLAVNQSTDSLTAAVEKRLLSQNVQTSEAISEYLRTIESQVRAKAFSSATVEAAQSFIPAFNNYTAARGNINASELNKLKSYYDVDFTKQYKKLNSDNLSNASGALSQVSDNGVALQFDFIANSSFELGMKDGLVDLKQNTAYADAHSKFHPEFRKFLNEFSYYDIFIADAASGNIVYSVFKELDFATSLKSGPYAKTEIGAAFEAALNAKPESVNFSNIAPYLPSYNAFAGFISAPIYANDKVIAVLIFQMPMGKINSLATHHSKWNERGFGESGETYFVGDSGFLLTESRFFIEDKDNYIKTIAVQIKDTSIGLQPVESLSAQKALAGEKGFNVFKDYRGVEVFSAYSPLKMGDHVIGVIAEVDVDEALRPAKELARSLVTSTFILGIGLLFVAILITLWLAAKLVSPLNQLGKTCDGLGAGDGDLTIKINSVNIPEIDRIIVGFNIFIRQIRDIVIQLKIDADSLASASEELSNITKSSLSKTAQQRDQSFLVATAMKQLTVAVEEGRKSTVHTNYQSLQAQKS
mgnify:CR=1 FL=1